MCKEWTIYKQGDEWVADNGNGVFVFADHRLKLVAWFQGLLTPKIGEENEDKISL